MHYSTEQQAIIEHLEGHAKVEAVAGSGKTHALVGRVTRLLQQAVLPEHILVIMYGRDACNDFAARLKKANPDVKVLPEVKTFHSIVGTYVHQLMEVGILPKWEVLANDAATFTQFQLCQHALQHVGKSRADEDSIRDVQIMIAKVKADYDMHNDAIKKLSKKEGAVFKAYEAARHQAKVRFFDDLFYDFWRCLADNPGLKQLFRSRIKHIIVDEYQDINQTQQCLLRSLYENTRAASVMVVGDANQTIYEFRGSRPEIMLTEFQQVFQKPTCYQLSQTFRFGKSVSQMANRLIAHNKSKVDLTCVSHESIADTDITLVPHADFSMKAMLTTLKKAKVKPTTKTVSLLVREYHHAYRIEAECLAAKLPYSITPGKSFLNTNPAQSILSYLRLADEGRYLTALTAAERLSAVQRMLSCPRLYIKSEYRTRLANQLAANPTALSVFNEVAALIEKEKVAKSVLARRQAWDAALSVWGEDDAEMALLTLRQKLRYATYFDYSTHTVDDAKRKMAAINALIALAKRKKQTVTEFLQYMESISKTALNPPHTAKKAVPLFSINTIHNAKGLEWDTVIIPELIAGGFPSADAIEKGQLESERRLCYVALTRARKRLYLVGYPADDEKASPFLREALKIETA